MNNRLTWCGGVMCGPVVLPPGGKTYLSTCMKSSKRSLLGLVGLVGLVVFEEVREVRDCMEVREVMVDTCVSGGAMDWEVICSTFPTQQRMPSIMPMDRAYCSCFPSIFLPLMWLRRRRRPVIRRVNNVTQLHSCTRLSRICFAMRARAHSRFGLTPLDVLSEVL